ncbi:MAG: ATPase, T2SS/T4P/T4SS family [Planctomycetota bacterium]|nr:ATPase, T2SS/T4P/T4SS family [Planctomycetota bacterium]MDA1178908.1 ATPase, T2SS/T4P/T4SS family [Planctomycetota bacterium]
MQEISQELAGLVAQSENYAVQFVDRLLREAVAMGWSNLHLQPVPLGLEVRVRRDGILQQLGVFPRGSASDIVMRLKVLADLLTYQQEIPQEGRLRDPSRFQLEMRVSTFPTLHGERAVVRLFGAQSVPMDLSQLGLPVPIQSQLEDLLSETHGAILITGPAGSGKTTTAYACLRYIAQDAERGRNIMTLEDPIECALDGVCQTQIRPHVGLNMENALRSLLRHDPEVVLVGELRDASVAAITMQAALTGQLIVSTFHADDAATAVARLLDMAVEPFCVRSGLLAVLSQRLVRRLCSCKQSVDPTRWGFSMGEAWMPAGCGACAQSGYRGRFLLSELLTLEDPRWGRHVLGRSDATVLQQCFEELGGVSLWQQAQQSVFGGLTSPQEIRRIFGARRISDVQR